MTKPIFVIKFSSNLSPHKSNEMIQEMAQHLDRMGLSKEYHVIFAPGDCVGFEFECYNPDNMPNDLKEEILKALNEMLCKSTQNEDSTD